MPNPLSNVLALLTQASNLQEDQRNHLMIEAIRSLSTGAMYSASFTLTDDQIKNLPIAPIEILPSLPGFAQLPIYGYVKQSGFAANPYGNTPDPAALTANALVGPTNDGPSLTDLADFFAGTYDPGITFGQTTTGPLNDDPVILQMDGGGMPLTGGDAANEMTVTIFYFVVPLS